MLFAFTALCSCDNRFANMSYIIDSLRIENECLREELDKYKQDPTRLLASIRQSCENRNFLEARENLELLKTCHPEAPECADAGKIYEQALKEWNVERKKMEELMKKEEAQKEAQRAKAEAEKDAKIKPEDRIMEEFGCSQDMAKNIRKGVVQIGMTQEMVIAAWGRPISTQSMGGHYGVFEEWRYANRILIFKDGKLWRVPKKSDDMKFIFIQ